MQISHTAAIVGPVLGIESSCDETAAAVLAPDGRVLAEAVLSQETDHAPYGGVVPEIAARAHLAHLPGLVSGVLDRARVTIGGLAGIAASAGPGLIGGLIVGSQFAKGLAIARRLPYVAVNHLEAHALTARLPGLVEGGAPFPYLLLLVSGGHCQLVAVEAVGRYRRLGGTVDDAAGEAFDKVAKLLGLGWPGGPALERLALAGDPARYRFPRPMLGRVGCDFSFSGLKTAVAQTVARLPEGALPAQVAADIAAGFQAAVTEVLADRASHAMAMMATAGAGGAVAGGAVAGAEVAGAGGAVAMMAAPGAGGAVAGMDVAGALFADSVEPASSSTAGGAGPRDSASLLVVAGGVAANQAVRAALGRAAAAHGFRLAAPPIRLCTDNAVMVAWAGLERLRLGVSDGIDFAPRPRWPLESMVPETVVL